MRLRILRDRMFAPGDRRHIAFKAGAEVTVKRAWGEALVADGAAEEIGPPATSREIARDEGERDEGAG